MRRRGVAIALTAMMAAVLFGAVPASARQSPHSTQGKVKVKIVDFAFKPKTVSVPVGTVMIWVNRGTVGHTTTSDTGLWNSGTLAPGTKFKKRFKDLGTFTYHCSIHPSMTGTISVALG